VWFEHEIMRKVSGKRYTVSFIILFILVVQTLSLVSSTSIGFHEYRDVSVELVEINKTKTGDYYTYHLLLLVKESTPDEHNIDKMNKNEMIIGTINEEKIERFPEIIEGNDYTISCTWPQGSKYCIDGEKSYRYVRIDEMKKDYQKLYVNLFFLVMASIIALLSFYILMKMKKNITEKKW